MISAVNTIVNDAAQLKKAVKGKAVVKSKMITKKYEGTISKMENH